VAFIEQADRYLQMSLRNAAAILPSKIPRRLIDARTPEEWKPA